MMFTIGIFLFFLLKINLIQGNEVSKPIEVIQSYDLIQKWNDLYKNDPHNQENTYQLGESYYKLHDFRSAKIYYKKTLELNPDHTDALLRLSYLSLWEGDLEAAEEGFQKILKAHPDYKDAQEGLLKTTERKRDLNKKNKDFLGPEEEAKKLTLEKKPDDTEENLVNKALKTSDLNQAILLWTKLYEKYPEKSEYSYRLGESYAQKKDYIQAEFFLQQALNLDPSNTDALLRLSYVYLWQDKKGLAIAGFQKILETHPDYEDAIEGLKKAYTSKESYHEEGGSFYEKELVQEALHTQDADQAIEIWLELFHAFPQKSEYSFHLGTLYAEKKDYETAEKYLIQSLEADKENMDALLKLSYVYLWQNKKELAIEGFQKILESHPEYQEAKEGLEKAYASDEKEEGPKKVSLYEQELLETAKQAKSPDEALEIWLKLHNEFPKKAEYSYQVGESYSKKKDFKQAEIYLKKSLELDPDNNDALLRLSYVYLWQEKFKEAIAGFEKILKKDPDYQDAKDGLKKANEQQLAKNEKKDEKPKRTKEEERRIECAKALDKRSILDLEFLVWRLLLCDYPNDPEYLYNTGKVAAWIGRFRMAERYLRESLCNKGFRDDALLKLGYLYLLLERWDESYESLALLLDRNPEYGDAYLALARLDFRTRFFCRARNAYHNAYLFIKGKYDKNIAWREYYDTRLLLEPSIRLTEKYAQELEKDLETKEEAARRYVWLNEARYQVALKEGLIGYQEVGAGYEREKNLANGLNNFYVHTFRSTTGLDYFYSPMAKLTAGVTFKEASNRGDPIYKFQNAIRVEPWCGVDLRKIWHHSSLNYYRDSFIVKNFQEIFSFFLARDNFDFFYEYQALPLAQFAGASGYYRKYHDDIRNDEGRGRFWLQTTFPKYKENFVIRYQFEIGGFRETETDYYSFKKQWEHLAKIYYWRSWSWLDYAEIAYQHGWRSSRDLNQPINAVFFLKKQFINTNRVTMQIRKVFRSSRDVNFEALYYWDTAGYRAFALRGDYRWIF
ncbi:tetratricopeptide repeat protein [Criblamydia sequanensis]|uniref:Tetratricopeptide repeat protein n=1 Tax=Candidatus Criblamydia sequanensis CRIB-18 TaxID=1437425 RepID=A0A090CZ71_9BACT|nr:tetratricopeptide repeat protein [Criblamydia sequanensis]CDR34227.1 hypothetical protein CSEC_1408 [Criblamydia sequanensis CRIB-18]